MEKEKLGYFCEAAEYITVELIERIEEAKQKYIMLGIGIFSDELVRSTYHHEPLRPYEERARIVNALKGVNFTFKVDDPEFINVFEPEAAIDDYAAINHGKKEYEIGYAPGTYDLFHAGHLEHLIEAKKQCRYLIVGINKDELVQEYKNKTPRMDENERAYIVNATKIADAVYIADSLERGKANEWIQQAFGHGIDAVFIGSDWQGQDLHNPENLNIVFTERDPEKMKERSSSNYREKMEEIENGQREQ